jgi:hypothetical protein
MRIYNTGKICLFNKLSVKGSATGTCGGVVGGQRLGGWALRGPLLLHGGQRELVLPREGAEVVIEVVGSQARAHCITVHRRLYEEKFVCTQVSFFAILY